MATTRTGGFGIGLRRGHGAWQKDTAALIAWAKQNDFACLDVFSVEDVDQVVAADLAVGSVDLPGPWKDLITDDAELRRTTQQRMGQFVCSAVEAGATNFFAVLLPSDPQRDRRENFDLAIEGFKPLLDVMAKAGAKLVIEGWPGPGALCCTPESYRAFFEAVDSPAAGVNYDPSHLIRMGIDPLRFVREFADRVFHVHAKDTELLAERQYELGTEQPATFAERIGFGGGHWRYCIPGHGCMRWSQAFKTLAEAGYNGGVSIELEDAHFNGSEEGEQRGLILSRQYLEGC